MKIYFKILADSQFISDAYYRTAFSEAILKMQERGELKRLKNKWWIEKNANKECTVKISHKTHKL